MSTCCVCHHCLQQFITCYATQGYPRGDRRDEACQQDSQTHSSKSKSKGQSSTRARSFAKEQQSQEEPSPCQGSCRGTSRDRDPSQVPTVEERLKSKGTAGSSLSPTPFFQDSWPSTWKTTPVPSTGHYNNRLSSYSLIVTDIDAHLQLKKWQVDVAFQKL